MVNLKSVRLVGSYYIGLAQCAVQKRKVWFYIFISLRKTVVQSKTRQWSVTIHGECKCPVMSQYVAGWIVSDVSVFPPSSRSSTLFLGCLTLKTQGETSEIYQVTRRYIPEDLNLSNTAVRTLNIANNKHIFTSTLHSSVLNIPPDMSSGRPGYYNSCCPTVPPLSAPQLNITTRVALLSLHCLYHNSAIYLIAVRTVLFCRYQSVPCVISHLIRTVLAIVQIWPSRSCCSAVNRSQSLWDKCLWHNHNQSISLRSYDRASWQIACE